MSFFVPVLLAVTVSAVFSAAFALWVVTEALGAVRQGVGPTHKDGI